MQIACSHCGATYAFDATLIPQEGYDARCTSCQGVFFVHPKGDSAQSVGPTAAGAVEDTGEAAQVTFSPESLHRGTMELNEDFEAPGPAKATRQSQGIQDARDGRHRRAAAAIDDDVDMGPRLGRARRGQEVDNEPMLMRKPWARRGLFLGVALVAVIGSGVVVGVVCSKRLHAPPSVQPPIHVVRAPDPIAAEAFSRGMKALWDDTATGYLAAAKAFDAARARDPEFTDAWAGAALAALLQSDDVHAAAQIAVRASQALAQNTLAEASRGADDATGHGADGLDDADADTETSKNSGRNGASVAQRLRLQKTWAGLLQQSQQRAQALHEEAYDLQRRGASLLLHGDHLMTQTPLMALALAMWYVSDPTNVPLARRQLRAFEQLMGGDCMPVEADPNSCIDSNPVALAAAPAGLSAKMAETPYGPLAFWIEARITASGEVTKPDAQQNVVAAYEKALTLKPELRRARWELAQYELRLGRTEVARPLLEDLAHGTPPHDKAQADLNQLLAQGAAAAGAAP